MSETIKKVMMFCRKGGRCLVDLHYFSGVPVYGVVVEISGWIKPEVELLFSASISLGIDIRVDGVRLSRYVP